MKILNKKKFKIRLKTEIEIFAENINFEKKIEIFAENGFWTKIEIFAENFERKSKLR